MSRWWWAGVVASGGLAFALAAPSGAGTGPRYDESGALAFPEDFETWIFVGASLGLTYADNPPAHEMFHHVYIEPASYRHYVETGEFPDETMLAMTLYDVAEKTDFGSGSFSGELVGVEVAVKDESRFDEGWAYYGFGGRGGLQNIRSRATAFSSGSCHDCHAAHAADDNVFVQFYPILRRSSRR